MQGWSTPWGSQEILTTLRFKFINMITKVWGRDTPADQQIQVTKERSKQPCSPSGSHASPQVRGMKIVSATNADGLSKPKASPYSPPATCPYILLGFCQMYCHPFRKGHQGCTLTLTVVRASVRIPGISLAGFSNKYAVYLAYKIHWFVKLVPAAISLMQIAV